MARGLQLSKMGKRKRVTKQWGTKAKKRNGRAQAGQIIGLGPKDFGFPDRLRTKLRYCDTYTLTASTVMKQQAMKMNDLYDPDQTGLGHQPMWYDQFTAVYNQYTVRYAKLTATFTPTDPPSLTGLVNAPTLVGVIGSQASSISASNARTLMELNDGDLKLLGDQSGGNNVKTCVITYEPLRDTGFSADDSNNKTLVTTSPTTLFYANVFKFSQAAFASNVVVNVCIDYHVEFSDRKEATAS